MPYSQGYSSFAITSITNYKSVLSRCKLLHYIIFFSYVNDDVNNNHQARTTFIHFLTCGAKLRLLLLLLLLHHVTIKSVLDIIWQNFSRLVKRNSYLFVCAHDYPQTNILQQQIQCYNDYDRINAIRCYFQIHESLSVPLQFHTFWFQSCARHLFASLNWPS